MEEYRPNSHKSKETQKEGVAPPDKKVEKVISGSAKPKKKGEMQKFADVFISEDVGNIRHRYERYRYDSVWGNRADKKGFIWN